MNHELRIYDQLLQFTLFQGMSHADLMEVVTHTKFGFMKKEAGKRIAREGAPCTQLVFLIGGTLKAESQSPDRAYRVRETLAAPRVLQPEHLFGLTQRYTATFTTETPCHFIIIDKKEVLSLLESQLVFRLNLTGLLATEAQRLRLAAWRGAPATLRQRIIRFLFAHCLHPAGHKTFYIRRVQLAQELNAKLQDIYFVLHQMQDEGLLTLNRGNIDIPMLERLLM